MRPTLKMIASVLASAALVASSTAAVAAAAPAPAQAAQTQAPSGWMALSMLSPTRAVALGGANAAAQPADQPPPPPPPPEYAGRPVIGGEVIAIGLWAILIIIALTISGESGSPNSAP